MWFVVSLLIVATLVVGEAVYLGLRYPHLFNTPGRERISFGRCVLTEDGEWGASCVMFSVEERAPARGGHIVPQVRARSSIVAFNLRDRFTMRLQLDGVRPCLLAISPASGDLLIGCDDGSIRVVKQWHRDLRFTGSRNIECQTFVTLESRVRHLLLSPDGRWLVGMANQILYVWDWPAGRLLRKRPVPEELLAGRASFQVHFPEPSISLDGRCLLTSSASEVACLWDLGGDGSIRSISLDGVRVETAVLSPDGQHGAIIVVGHNGRRLRLYRLDPRSVLRHDLSIAIPHPSIAFSECGELLATTDRDRGTAKITIFNTVDGQKLREWPIGTSPPVSITFGSDDRLYTSDTNGDLHVWDAGRGRKCGQWSILEGDAKCELFPEFQ